MGLWTFNVTHKNQTTTTGSLTFNPPGVGNAVTVPNVSCMCGYSHTLVGTQTGANAMSGSGPNSVAPPNDPRAKPSIKADDEPSWTGNPGSPLPRKSSKAKKSSKATKSSKAKKASKAKTTVKAKTGAKAKKSAKASKGSKATKRLR